MGNHKQRSLPLLEFPQRFLQRCVPRLIKIGVRFIQHDQGGIAIPAHPLVPYPLCAQGFVLRRHDKVDRRRVSLTLSVKGKRVLDIGTGAGLLAMLAARNGAKSVTTCESVGVIAHLAREILAKNGMTIHKPSAQLTSDMKKIGDVLLQDWLKKAGPDGQAVVDAYRKM